jgi:putative flippase GtrA
MATLATRGMRLQLGKMRQYLGKRQLLFIAVGATCFLVQYVALTVMAAAGVNRPVANALGFVLSAQLNFILSSRLTWRDRSAGNAKTLWARLIAYNGTALISLAVNTAVFTLVYQRIGNLAGAAVGVICGMCVTYLVCDLLIFREQPKHATARRSRQRLAAGVNGAGVNGAGVNGAGVNGAGVNGAGVNGAGVDGAGVNGRHEL